MIVEAEVDVIAALTCVGVSEPFYKVCRADETQRRGAKHSLTNKRRIVREGNVAQVHRTIRGVEQLEPISVTVGGIGHPLVETKSGVVAENCRCAVDCTRRSRTQQAPLSAAQTDGQVVHLRAVFDEVHDLAVHVEQVNAAAVAIERFAGVERARVRGSRS